MGLKPLHWRFYVADRQKEVVFYKEVLGMKILRHEEFTNEAEQSMAKRSSKTIVGYEGDGFFKIELHYSYGTPTCEPGNDFLGVTIVSKIAIARAKALNWPIKEIGDKLFSVRSPEGINFYLMNQPTVTECDPIVELCLRSSYITATIAYWKTNFNAQVISEENDQATLSFGDDKCKIRFVCWFGQLVKRSECSGHLTLSMPKKKLEILEYHCLENNLKHSSQQSIVEPGYSTLCRSLTFQDLDNHKIVIVEEERYAPLVIPNPDAQVSFDLSLAREQRRNEQSNPIT